MERNINLDILRIMAAVMVLLIHINGNFWIGGTGVQIFFMLGGYLAFVTIGRGESAIQYYRGRIRRILPTYYFCLILLYISEIVLGVYNNSVKELFSIDGQCGIRFLRYVLGIHCMIPSNNWIKWNNYNALWTMSSFFFFYLVCPLMYRLVKNVYFGIGILIGAISIREWMLSLSQTILNGFPKEAKIDYYLGANPLSEIYCFLFGAVLYVAIREGKQFFYLLVVGTLMMFEVFSINIWELVYLLLLSSAIVSGNFIKNSKLTKTIIELSKLSFTLYLTHPLTLRVWSMILSKLRINSIIIRWSSSFVLSVLATCVIYYCFIVNLEQWLERKKRNSEYNRC